ISISLESKGGKCFVRDFRILDGKKNLEFDCLYIERVFKFLLWMIGGNRAGIYGDSDIADYIVNLYQTGGAREFDASFMAKVYEEDFLVESKPLNELPCSREEGIAVGGNLEGCRIGFDAGGSDLKVCAVQNGEVLFSQEVVWHPKLQEDPAYHYEWILSTMKKAAAYLPRVDAIGVSSAGIYVDNRCMVASLFIKVPMQAFDENVKDIYIRAAREIGAPLVVLNDGDVAALAGATGMETNSILGIAMGTSEAAGFVDGQGNIKGWLNELAFAPVDLNENAMMDEWSGDVGCGVKYFSQDGVIKLAEQAGIKLNDFDSPAQKLAAVQKLMDKGDLGARKIYESIGICFGHT
ncbi:MAG: ROK family protein, partial [Eubacteriales bacterium]